jgi:hypothetical protein
LDWQRLQRALQGRDVTIPRAQAVALIVASGRPDAPRTLARVLQDPAEPPRLRALTALSLPRLSSPTAEEVLIEATRVEDDTVLAAVMRALGRVGGERALRAIEAAKPTSTVAVQQAAFAAALISHRLGLPGHDLREPPSRELLTLPDAAARPFRIEPVDDIPSLGAQRDRLFALSQPQTFLALNQTVIELVSGSGCDRSNAAATNAVTLLGDDIADHEHRAFIIRPRPNGHFLQIGFAGLVFPKNPIYRSEAAKRSCLDRLSDALRIPLIKKAVESGGSSSVTIFTAGDDVIGP